jgi:hypothetical protein
VRLTLEPADIFLLLLNLDVVGDHVGKLGVDAALLKVTLKVRLQILIEVLEGRAGVQALAGPVLLSGNSMGKVGLGEEGNFFDLEKAILSEGLDEEGAVAGLLNGHIDARGEAGLEVTVNIVKLAVSGGDAVLGVLCDVSATAGVDGLVTLEVEIVGEAGIKVILFAQVLEVGDSKCKANPRR